MTATESREIRSIAKKYHAERTDTQRTEEPLLGDYEAFRHEFSGDVGSEEITMFEEEWVDIYQAYQ